MVWEDTSNIEKENRLFIGIFQLIEKRQILEAKVLTSAQENSSFAHTHSLKASGCKTHVK